MRALLRLEHTKTAFTLPFYIGSSSFSIKLFLPV